MNAKQQTKDREDEGFRRILEDPGGRAFVFRLLRSLGVYGSLFRGDRVDDTTERELLFRASRQEFGKSLRDEAFRVNPAKFQEMEREGYREYMEEKIEAHKKPQKKEGDGE